MLTTSLLVVCGSLIALLSLLWLAKCITNKQYAGWMTIIYALGGVLCAVNGWTDVLYMNAGMTAWYAWMWWHSGGGDDTRRRLKSWAGRFQGVRRTASAATS